MTVDYDRLVGRLTRLKLTAIRDHLDSLLDDASGKGLSLLETLDVLIDVEVARKDERRISMHQGLARFPFQRSLETFDFACQPSIDRNRIEELATGRFIGNGDNVLFLGPPGVGKTHLAVGIGTAAIRQGYSVLFTSAAALIAALAKAASESRLEERLRVYLRPKLLIIDELGYVPFSRDAANLFFQLVSLRYERNATMITSNRTAYEWGEVFSDEVIATAILDRLLHHSHVITIKGESYRLKEKKRTGLGTQPRTSTTK